MTELWYLLFENYFMTACIVLRIDMEFLQHLSLLVMRRLFIVGAFLDVAARKNLYIVNVTALSIEIYEFNIHVGPNGNAREMPLVLGYTLTTLLLSATSQVAITLLPPSAVSRSRVLNLM